MTDEVKVFADHVIRPKIGRTSYYTLLTALGLICVMCIRLRLYYNVIQTHTMETIMKTEMLTTRIDHDTKLAFTHICDEVGLSPSQAIKLFARAVINYGGIPFELKAKQPNDVTANAILELSQGKGNRAESVTSLISELTEGKVNDVIS